MATAYLSLGSNLGDRRSHLEHAVGRLALEAGEIVSLSSLVETPAWGYESHHRFLNLALELSTRLSPEGLLAVCTKIESDMGRKKQSTGYADRVIDIDMLLFDQVLMQTVQLTLPHPRMAGRKFVLAPLAEIAPTVIDPLTGKMIAQLLASCTDPVEPKHIQARIAIPKKLTRLQDADPL